MGSFLHTYNEFLVPKWGCATVTDVVRSVFFFVSLSVGRFSRTVGKTHSLPSFGLRVGWSDLAMCVAVKRWFYFYFVIKH
jgi:hypothetical protein